MGSREMVIEKDYIVNSHERCKQYKVEQDRIYSKRMLSGDELLKRLDKKRDLLVTAELYMNQLYNLVKGCDFLVLITDEDGCILSAMGDDGILSEAFEIKMIPGAFMDEESIGTNAMSVVISEHFPVQVSGKEHFINAYHKWTCTAAPIRDINGEIIGILDLTGYRENVHPHSLGMVVEASNVIEKMLQINKYNSDLSIVKENTEVIFNSISNGILISDLVGNIVTMNSNVIDILGDKEGELSNKKMWEKVEGWGNEIESLYTKGCFVDEDIYINTKKNKKQDEGEKVVTFETTLTLDQVKKSHIIRVLLESNGNIKLAAKNLGIGRNSLHRKLEKYGINCSEFEHNSIMVQI
jgi:sigma-54 dependent transcriptional regulator, acetoin dehydrogenase operon transcriptional activator AcoR